MMRKAFAWIAVAVAGCGMEAADESSSFAAGTEEVSSNATRCVFNTKLSPENEIRAEPITDTVESTATGASAFYVNYHTTEDPQGATRGQLQ